jgi:uncharacterized membrane protein YhaH (DUF805 family)
MKMISLYFSNRGRIPRGSAWFAGVTAGGAFIVLYLLLGAILGRPSTLVLYAPFFWSLYAIASKRFHDRGKRAAWLLLLLVPLFGPLYVAWELGCRRGTRAENRYGSDPLAVQREYFTVQATTRDIQT